MLVLSQYLQSVVVKDHVGHLGNHSAFHPVIRIAFSVGGSIPRTIELQCPVLTDD